MSAGLPNPQGEAAVRYPLVVAGLGPLTGLVAAVSAVQVYTAKRDGMLRVTVSVQTTTGGDAITLDATVTLTDSVGSATVTLISAHSLNATGRSQATYAFTAKRGTAVSVATALSGARTASVHCYDAVVERLQ